jgi:hypothetical protein
MESCIDDTIGGYNTFIKSQPLDSILSLTLFDNEIIHMYKKPISGVVPLSRNNYIPRGSTALLDAIGYIIKQVPNDEIKPILVILTDGFENSSKLYTKLHINDLITEKRKLGWEFIFLAANQDAIATASEIGIGEMSALTFNTENVSGAFRSVSSAVSRTRTGARVEFSQEERVGSC